MNKLITWFDDHEMELEREVLAAYSKDEVQRHLEYLTSLTRLAGTEDELRAAEYVREKLEEYGISAQIHEFDAYIGYAGQAELHVISPVPKDFPCLAHAFVASTPSGGIEAEVISVGKGSEDDYRGLDARGKIVLIESGGGPDQVEAARIAEERGALAQIHVTSGKPGAISIIQLRNAWGSPTTETLHQLPKTPGISVASEDGRYLAELTKQGSTSVRLKADSWRGYKTIRQPIGTLNGTKEPEKFVLFGAHYCSWYVGATDNAAANSLLLEMARIFSKYRDRLARGIRFAWWAGHSQGTFAGSTWYLDNYWDDIRDHAVAYLVMDGLGRKGSSGFETRNTEEIRAFHEHVVKQVLGLEVKSRRVSKSGDQSYWGMGLPSFVGSTTFTKDEMANLEGQKVWYSHTVHDTLDKVDIDALSNPFKVNAVSILRLCNNPVLPFEFITVTGCFKKALQDLAREAPASVGLTSLLDQTEALQRGAEKLNQCIEKDLSILEGKEGRRDLRKKCDTINGCLMELSRILIPILSSRAGKYGQDPMGSRFEPIPSLQSLKQLSSMDPKSEEFKALRTSHLRERNKVSDALHAATDLIENALEGFC